MKRRHFLSALSLPFFASRAIAAPGDPRAKISPVIDEMRANWKALLRKDADVATTTAPLTLPEDEWRKRLEPASFYVLRQEGTERPFSSPLDKEKRAGVFVCAGCALPLFTSKMKFDSGTGWPSFFTSIPDHVATRIDRKYIYTVNECHCARCGGHQGHVFDDGPPPTHERWCINGVALRFIPA